MASGEGQSQNNNFTSTPWRRALKTSVAALLMEIGFQSAEVMALETLLEIIQAYISDIGRFSSAYAELAGRTHVMPSDVVMSLIESGFDIKGIPAYAKRDNKSVFMPPLQAAPSASPKVLQVGDKRKHPSHIPEHLPPFPDPHTYIKTPSYRQPANEYQLVRERAASQKRDVEVGLTKFIAKTGTTQPLFRDDKSAFPLIASRPSPMPYLAALLPKDTDLQDLVGKDPESALMSSQDKLPAGVEDQRNNPATESDMMIDNPYLCPVKIAKKSYR